MSVQSTRRGSGVLLVLVVVYGAASLLHFAHNALFLHQYPNLPAWLTPGEVWLSWVGITAIGALGYYLYRRRSLAVGFVMLAAYALLGFGGLDHYAAAPIQAHSMMMNATILTEVVAAAALLTWLVVTALWPQRAPMKP